MSSTVCHMAKNLEQWRLSQKQANGKPITCEEAARRLGVQEDVFYRWRTGERFPSVRSWGLIFHGMGRARGEWLGRGEMRRTAVAQCALWGASRGFPSADPPGWARLMTMIRGGK